ncbi:translocation/assembly module TamB domain-containing protein [Brumimicrobium aurantiacum]|uniref:Translocation and assembly module TamB C-terminal domain-containing protein n=1 Tax=Brumimicrobium aurantiacum TaxID=1737063 RepID=A0A3E1F0E9_9FLAO|nr:translocation/assembly module TamB domain-containing protein [Brumimicrobium aurantiacum]RFC55187.1 hypothetical protein DXU93_05030 [Brumimicrobium aurantiacum]
MAKLLKILGNFTLIVVEILTILIIVFAFAIRTSDFQTFLAQQGAVYMSKKLETKVSIGKVDITFLDRVYFDQLYIEDQEKDTLAYIDEFYTNFDLTGAMALNFNLDEVGVKDAKFALKKYKGQEDFNHQFILDYFASDTTPSGDTVFKVDIAKIEVENVNFSMEDFNDTINDFGVDFNHLNAENIFLEAENVEITPNEYKAKINHLALKEQSGFKIKRLKSEVVFGNEGLNLRNTNIRTTNSKIVADSFLLKTSDLNDFSHFTEKVQLISAFDTSDVSLLDVSYFAPQLQGMTDVVRLKGRTKEPVNNLQIEDLFLFYGKATMLKGNFSLPDFTNFSKANIDQQIDYISLNVHDLEQLELPNSASISAIEWPESLVQLYTVSAENLNLHGSSTDLHIRIDELNTNLGDIVFNNEFRVESDTNFNTSLITPLNTSDHQIEIKDFNINRLLNSSDYGKVNGFIGLDNAKLQNGNFYVNNVFGVLRNFTLYNYAYDYLILDDFSYEMKESAYNVQNNVAGNFYVRDDYLDLSFNGKASLGNTLDIEADIALECAYLNKLNPSLTDRGELNTQVYVDVTGKDFNDFVGEVVIDSIYYEEGGEDFHTTDFKGFIKRSQVRDSISIQSKVIDVQLHGKVDYENVVENIEYQLAEIIPTLNPNKEKEILDQLTNFKYNIQFKGVNDILNVFYPSLQIAKNARIDGYYVGVKNNLGLNLNADYLSLDSIKVINIMALQEISNQELLALIDVDSVTMNDTLAFQNIHFTGLAANGTIDSQLLFDDPSNSRSSIEFLTFLKDESGVDIKLMPSYININENRWDLVKKAEIMYSDSCLVVDGLKLEHEEQYLSANGQLSNSIYDKLYIDVMDLDLKEFSRFLGPDMELSGIANVAGYITTPLTDLQFFGEAIVEELYVNETGVGNISFGADYQSEKGKVEMFGDIFSLKKQTFAFEGDYLINKDEDLGHLDFDLNFKSTDISVVKEFLDPDVIRDLQGKLVGELKLTGTFQEPNLLGKIDFDEGKVNIALLGSDMFFNGEIESTKDGFFIDVMPIKDVEGNTGFITGSLFHDNFSNFIFEIIVNMKEHPTKRMPNDPSRALPVNRFKVMNTKYEIDSYYYGDAYVTGIANISGTLDDLSIIVNAKTESGTRFVLPMYGPTTIEDDGFITFKDAEKLEEVEKKVDLTGVELQLNFEVTEDALAKLIFDEKIGDEISARGTGNLSLSVNQFNELTMDGTYTVASGVYNFAMGPYKQNFNIQSGSTVQWAGDPLEALLDIDAFYKTTANLSVVMPNNVIDDQSSNNEEILSYLMIDGNMMNPEISFDIEAPKASESGKAVISRIKSDQDELNKQFFSILISKSFMPLATVSGGNGGAIWDLASTQINSLLNNISEEYQMNVNLENDEYSGQFSGEFGVSKGFLDDRLLVSGSFGVGTQQAEATANTELTNQNTLIGDVKVEYLLNEQGTFRMNVFNESNNYTVLQNEAKGQFTQGVGVSYKEDFHTLEDFKLFQFFANIFRKRENWVDLQESKDKRVPIPEKYLEEKGTKNEEE